MSEQSGALGTAAPRILVAPDKFKGSLTAAQVAEAVKEGVQRILPNAVCSIIPIADGGDGFLDAVRACVADCANHTVEVQDALGRSRSASFTVAASTAYIEIAQAVSITFHEPTPAGALRAGSEGVGQLIRAALDTGARRVVVGLGGSATSDGGVGMLRELGARILDEHGSTPPPGGQSLGGIAAVDFSGLDPRLRDVELVAAADVTNPLLGPNGAIKVFSPQKGADPEAVATLEAAMTTWHQACAQVGIDLDVQGGGAAGGLGSALVGVLGAHLTPGASLVMALSGFHKALPMHDLVLTGEGSFDRQSLNGKGPHAVIEAAASLGIPVAVVAGRSDFKAPETAEMGLAAVFALTDLFDDPFDETAAKLAALTGKLISTLSARTEECS